MICWSWCLSQVYVIDSVNPSNGLQKICNRTSGVQYFVEHHSGLFYILTNAPIPDAEWSGQGYYLVRSRIEDVESAKFQVLWSVSYILILSSLLSVCACENTIVSLTSLLCLCFNFRVSSFLIKIQAYVIWTFLMDIWFFSSLRKVFLCYAHWTYLCKLISRYMNCNFTNICCLPLNWKVYITIYSSSLPLQHVSHLILMNMPCELQKRQRILQYDNTKEFVTAFPFVIPLWTHSFQGVWCSSNTILI